MNQSRKITIQGKFHQRKWKTTTVPQIKLEGRWLEALGFKQGQTINIEQEVHKLIITIDREKEDNH